MSPGHVFPESSRGGFTCLAEPPSFHPPQGPGRMQAETAAQGGWGTGPFIARGVPAGEGPSDAGRPHPAQFTHTPGPQPTKTFLFTPLPLSLTMPPPVVSMFHPRLLSPLLCALSLAQPFVPLPRPDPSSLWDHLRSQVWSPVLVRPGGPGLGLP